jgi:hypothetical protein
MLSSVKHARRVLVSFASNLSLIISAFIRVFALSASPGRQQITKIIRIVDDLGVELILVPVVAPGQQKRGK